MGKEHGFPVNHWIFLTAFVTIEDLTKLKSHQKDREFLKIWLNNSKSSTSLGKTHEKAMESHGAGAAFRCRVSHGAGTASPVNSQPKVRCPMMLGAPEIGGEGSSADFPMGFPMVFSWNLVFFEKRTMKLMKPIDILKKIGLQHLSHRL